MFRISKSDDPFERHEGEDETANQSSASDDHGDNVASSALRWLRGSKKADTASPNGLRALHAEATDGDDAGTDDQIDDFELNEPLDLATFDKDGDRDSQDEQTASNDEGGETEAAAKQYTPAFALFDDDDDIDDFDDLGDLDGVTPPEPLEKTSILAAIDLDDLSSPEDLDDRVPLPVDLDPRTIEPRKIGGAARSFDDGVASEKAAIIEPAEAERVELPEPAELHRPEPLPLATPIIKPSKRRPVMDVPLEAPSSKKTVEAEPPAAIADAVPSPPLGTSLALQPIPELQSEGGPRPSSSQRNDEDPASAKPTEDDDDDLDGDLDVDLTEMLLDETADLDGSTDETDEDEPAEDMDDLGLAELGLDLDDSDDVVDRHGSGRAADAAASQSGSGELGLDIDDLGDDLGIAGLDGDPLELEASGEVDDRSGDDWHAHLADALGVMDDAEDTPSPEPATKPDEALSRLRENDQLPAMRRDAPAPVLPLSKTLSRLATSNGPGGDDLNSSGRTDRDVLVPPPPPLLPTRTARQKTSEGLLPTILPAETANLSPEQLSFGIIANLARLRRFVAAQIGEELIADRLVQLTIEKAFANPTALEPAFDLGLALITLSHRLRQDMLADPRTPIDMPEARRAFETVVCRGLAGADQFEIRQFARAVNALDEGDRELLVLVALENFSYDQIATMLRMPTERVMARVSGARMRLRLAMATDESGVTEARMPASDMPHDHEIEINGYLDGELDGHHMADIDALVEYDEDAADRLLHYGIQGDLIRRLYAPMLNRPIPGSLLDAVSAAARPARRGFRFRSRRSLIAGAVIIMLCGSAAWLYTAPPLDTLVSDAMAISQATVDR